MRVFGICLLNSRSFPVRVIIFRRRKCNNRQSVIMRKFCIGKEAMVNSGAALCSIYQFVTSELSAE